MKPTTFIVLPNNICFGEFWQKIISIYNVDISRNITIQVQKTDIPELLEKGGGGNI